MFFMCILPVRAGEVPKVSIKPLLKAWKISDHSQSLKAQRYNDSLTGSRDTAMFLATVDAIERHLKVHPNRRLNVRFLMYRALGDWRFKLVPPDRISATLQQAINQAAPLKDNQLNAELYALYADNCANEFEGLTYNLKALELQKQVGLRYFSFVQNRYFAVSVGMYDAMDYENSIHFGKEFLTYQDTAGRRWNPHVFILQLDILGAAYKKTGQYDSCAYYYEQLLSRIPTHLAHKDEVTRMLWEGIAKGNLGSVYTDRGEYSRARPLLETYLRLSRELRDSLNTAIAQNFMGQYYSGTGEYNRALSACREALAISQRLPKAQQHQLDALRQMAGIYSATRRPDSAFVYDDRYHRVQLEVNETFNSMKYASLNSRVAYDNLQHSLSVTEMKLSRTRLMRDFIIVLIFLLTVISVLVYKRKTTIDRHRLERARMQEDATRKEIKFSKKQLENFSQNIREKNALIESLNRRLNEDTADIHNKLLKQTLLTNEQWSQFRVEFEKAYPLFFHRLNEQTSHRTTPAEERMAALIFLGLNNQEIGSTLGIGSESVSRSKRRLRANFSAGTKELEELIQGLLVK